MSRSDVETFHIKRSDYQFDITLTRVTGEKIYHSLRTAQSEFRRAWDEVPGLKFSGLGAGLDVLPTTMKEAKRQLDIVLKRREETKSFFFEQAKTVSGLEYESQFQQIEKAFNDSVAALIEDRNTSEL